jgi:hypothetical protein
MGATSTSKSICCDTVTIYANDDDAGRGNAINLARSIKARGIEVRMRGL